MPIDRLLVIGAGGHAKVVLDAVRMVERDALVEVRDDHPDQAATIQGFPIRAPVGDPSDWPGHVHVAIGNNGTRRQLSEQAVGNARRLHTVVHPRATVSTFAALGAGTFVAAGALIAPSAVVEVGVIINHGAIVDHDCRIGSWTHIAPGAVLGGGVRVGAQCLIGSGAVILPNLKIDDGAVIGSGAVVTRDVCKAATVLGVPAREKARLGKGQPT